MHTEPFKATAKDIDPQWLTWVKQLQALAQTGLTYSKDVYDIERYHALSALAAEIAAQHTDAPLEMIRDLFTAEVGHATPKVDVRAAVFRNATILLVRERSDGLWTLPGGWADVGESPSIAAVRETAEESGYQTRAVKLLALYDRDKHGHPPHPFHIYKLIFQCELLGGAPTESGETDAVDFFAEDQLPPLSTSRVTAAQIARFFDHYRNPHWPTDFD